MTTRRPPIRFRGYRVGVEWIARNDNSGEGDDLETVSGYISTLLLADLVGRTGTQVARDVLRKRRELGLPTPENRPGGRP